MQTKVKFNHALRPFLDKWPNIRILVGIYVDNLVADAPREGLGFFKNHDKTKEDFVKKIKKDIEKANYYKETEIISESFM